MRNSRTCLIGLSVLLAGCNLPERVANIGRVPPLSPIENPTQAPGYQPVSLPMPAPEPLVSAQPNSLWRTGAKGFFRDLRARRVGDVLTVSVVIDDKAQLDNESRRQRDYSDGVISATSSASRTSSTTGCRARSIPRSWSTSAALSTARARAMSTARSRSSSTSPR